MMLLFYIIYIRENTGWKDNDTLEDIQARDQIKNNYAIKNKIPLIRIPYYERDNICTQTIFNPKYFVYC